MPVTRDPNTLALHYGREQLTITKVPCPTCPKCSHVEAVDFTIEGEEPQRLTGAAADVVWDIASASARGRIY